VVSLVLVQKMQRRKEKTNLPRHLRRPGLRRRAWFVLYNVDSETESDVLFRERQGTRTRWPSPRNAPPASSSSSSSLSSSSSCCERTSGQLVERCHRHGNRQNQPLLSWPRRLLLVPTGTTIEPKNTRHNVRKVKGKERTDEPLVLRPRKGERAARVSGRVRTVHSVHPAFAGPLIGVKNNRQTFRTASICPGTRDGAVSERGGAQRLTRPVSFEAARRGTASRW